MWVQFDKVMACIEDVDGGEPQGFKEECDRDFLLTVRPGGLAPAVRCPWVGCGACDVCVGGGGEG